MNTPYNTGAADPIEKLLVSLGANGSGIEAQEAQGQRELVQSSVLPSLILHCTQEDFEALGFVFGDEVAGDPLFREVTLPQGWTREGSDHAMWSHILDTRGIRMVDVFYKAAFYDRKAHMWLAHPGIDLATSFIYGDAEEPNLHPELTVDELAEAKSRAIGYLNDASRSPDIYTATDRATALLQAIEAKS